MDEAPQGRDDGMIVTNDKRREVAAKVRETMGALGQVELDGIPLADLIEPEECDGYEPGAWEVVAMEVAERLGVAVGGCLPSDYADAIGEALDRRLMPEGMEWLLDVWPKWSNGDYCKFGDWWKADKYGEYEPQQLRRLVFYTPEQLREGEQDEGDNFGYVWDFMRPSDTTYRPDKVEPPAPKVLDADGVEIRVGDTVYLLSGDWCDEFPCLGYHGGEELEVFSLHADHVRGGIGCRDTRRTKGICYPQPSQLTHERPDSWERLEEDARRLDIDLNDTTDGYPRMSFCRDLVRRARMLAERGLR